MITDLRYALRQLAKSPGFTAIGVITLALGIAATASLFSVVNGLIRDPLPYPEPDQLVQIWHKDTQELINFMPVSTPDYFDLQERSSSFSAFGVFTVRRFNLGGDQPEAVTGAACSPGLFHALNVRPLHGRWFTRADDVGPATAAVILSHALWRQQFDADPNCIGHTLRLDGRDHIIVGVMPENFALLSAWTRERPLALWTLLPLTRDGSRNSFWLGTIARVKPGVSAAHLDADLKAVAQHIVATDPTASPHRTFWLIPLSRQLGGLAALRVSVLFAAGWTLLVLAANNVSGLLLARGISRQPEMAVRLALGARRGHIIRLVLAESLLLSLIASGLAFLLTLWCMDGLASLLPPEVLPRGGLHIDASLLLCIVALTAVSTQMAGLTPALLAAKVEVVGNLKDGDANTTAARRTQKKLRRLVITQIALALFLVNVAMQLSSSYRDMLASSGELLTDRVITSALAVKGQAYRDDAARVAFWNRLLENTAALPGVQATAVTSKLPFDGGISQPVLIDDEPYDRANDRPYIEVSYVSPGFFSAIDATLLQGRILAANDHGERSRAVVVNRAFAQRSWPNQIALGHHLRAAQPSGGWTAEVVGVIDDVRQVAERPARPEMYFSFADASPIEAFLLVRTDPVVAAPGAALRQELRRLDPDLAFAPFVTLESLFTKQSRVITVITSIVNALSIAILGLAALGLYGSLSFHFRRRQREIGVRIALGASTPDILRLAFVQAAKWVIAGLVAGSAGVLLWALVLRAAMHDASAFDAARISLCAAVVTATAILAAWLPARRATRINPLDALRAE